MVGKGHTHRQRRRRQGKRRCVRVAGLDDERDPVTLDYGNIIHILKHRRLGHRHRIGERHGVSTGGCHIEQIDKIIPALAVAGFGEPPVLDLDGFAVPPYDRMDSLGAIVRIGQSNMDETDIHRCGQGIRGPAVLGAHIGQGRGCGLVRNHRIHPIGLVDPVYIAVLGQKIMDRVPTHHIHPHIPNQKMGVGGGDQ